MMAWFFFRLLMTFLAIGIGFGVGHAVGRWFHTPLSGALIGAFTGASFALMLDALYAQRLIRWLAGSHERSAPRGRGLWGELGYRIERSVRTHEALLVLEQKRLSQFLSAIEAAPNGIMLLDTDDQITWCNLVAAEHFGLHPERDLRQPVTNLIRTPGFVAYMQAGQFSEPVLVRDFSRGRMTLSVLLKCYGDDLKLLLSNDVTERERAETMRRDFVANVSHEIRTPLTVISASIETLRHLKLTEPEQNRILDTTAQQTQRMQTLVSDLLTLALLEGSPRPPADCWIEVAALFKRVHSDASALSTGRHQLTMSEVPAAVCLAGNESELLSALGNLVSNAIRYTPDGGQIILSWRLGEEGSAEISIQDNGIGIAKEHLLRLTERFYRVDSSRSRDTGGTGLGLSIVKHVIQRHGGSLDIQSTVGQGSRFTLVFPAARLLMAAA
jgi:two-component system, OmpR family, phosphate regulon sensor histidine kinase PhoR